MDLRNNCKIGDNYEIIYYKNSMSKLIGPMIPGWACFQPNRVYKFTQKFKMLDLLMEKKYADFQNWRSIRVKENMQTYKCMSTCTIHIHVCMCMCMCIHMCMCMYVRLLTSVLPNFLCVDV